MSNNWTATDILEKDTHSSVTRRRLTKTSRGQIGLFQKAGLLRGWLYDEPFIQYVKDGEVVEYLFVSPQPVTEITAGQKHELEPKSGYSSIIGLTNERVLIAVARKPENDTRTIPYSNIEEFAIQPISNLSVNTEHDGSPKVPSAKVHFEFETAHRTISYHSGPSQFLTTLEILNELGPTLQQRTGGAKWTEKTPWEEIQEEYHEAVEVYERRQEQITTLADRAEDRSVTPTRVEKIWDRLNHREQPHYYTTGDRHQHAITRSQGLGPSDSSHHQWSIFSDQRIFIQNRSTSYEIRYTDVQEFTINEQVHEPDESTERVVQIDIEMADEVHIIDIQSLSQPQLSNLTRFVRRRLQNQD